MSENETNQTASDARELLKSYNKSVVVEFVAQFCPELATQDRLSKAKFRDLRKDVNDNVEELREKLEDVATLHGIELDDDTVEAFGEIRQTLADADDQLDEQLELFAEAPDPEEAHADDNVEEVDVEGEIDGVEESEMNNDEWEEPEAAV